MASTSPTSASSSTSSSSPTSTFDAFSPTEWTQRTMFGDLMQQKGLLIGVALVVVGFLFFRSRSRSQETAARHLVRDWRQVDDPDDARSLLGSNLPVIMRPALLAALEEIERQVDHGFRRLERQISRL